MRAPRRQSAVRQPRFLIG